MCSSLSEDSDDSRRFHRNGNEIRVADSSLGWIDDVQRVNGMLLRLGISHDGNISGQKLRNAG